MELYTAGGWLVDGDGPMPVFTAGRLRWYTGTIHTRILSLKARLRARWRLRACLREPRFGPWEE
jgi:hypothetical protein